MRTRKFLSTLIPALPMLLAALLVILVTVIFLTAMRSKAHAQFGGAEQPMFQNPSSSYSVTNDPGMQYYWNYQDLSLGRITSWTDRIQALQMTRFDTANGPTNTTDGLYFHRQTTRTSLTNTFLVYGTNQALCFIWKPLESLNSFAVFGRMTNGAPPGTIQYNTPQAVGEKYTGTLQSFDDVSTDSYFYTNFHDLTLCFSNTVKYTFTNGVYSFSASELSPRHFFAMKSIGQDPTSAATFIGGGYIREVLVLTNVSNPSVLASNIHYYRTNTYGNIP